VYACGCSRGQRNHLVITRLSKGSRTEYSPNKENTMKKGHGFFIGFAVIAIAAMVTLAGCPTDGDGDGGGGGGLPTGNLGETLTISNAQVYSATSTAQGYTYTALNTAKTVTVNGATGTAAIDANGKLTGSFTAPASLSAITGLTALLKRYDDTSVTASDPTAQYAHFFLGIDMHSLDYGNTVISVSGTSGTMTSEDVLYVYVNKDLTITGTGQTTTEGTETITVKDFTLNLKKGWNALYRKTSASWSMTSSTYTTTTSVGNPANLKWWYNNSGA
jgi:hypothetical protein